MGHNKFLLFQLSLIFFSITFTKSAIISNSNSINTPTSNLPTVNTLSRTLIYKVTSSSQPNDSTPPFTAFVTVASSNITCGGIMCYYIWLNNYTIYNNSNKTNLETINTSVPMIFLQVFSNKTCIVVKNTELEKQVLNVLEVARQIVNSLIPQFSNLNTLNQDVNNTNIFTFKSLTDILSNKTISNQLSSIFDFSSAFINFLKPAKNKPTSQSQDKINNLLLSARILIINNNNKFSNKSNDITLSDLIIMRDQSNIFTSRDIKMETNKNAIYYKAELIDDNIFMDLSRFYRVSTTLSNKKNNIQNFPLNNQLVQLGIDKITLYQSL